MRRPISVKREHPAEPMIPDVSTATGTNSKSGPQVENIFVSSSPRPRLTLNRGGVTVNGGV